MLFNSLLLGRGESNSYKTPILPNVEGYPSRVCAVADRHRFKALPLASNFKKEVVSIILFNLLHHPEVRCAVFKFPAMLARLYQAFPSPSVNVCATKHLVRLTLTDSIWICLSLLKLMGNASCKVIHERVIADHLVGKLNT